MRDVSRKLTHEVNNAANGVAVNLEVVRSRTTATGAASESIGPFAQRASDQLEQLTTLQEVLRSLLQLTIEHLDEDGVSCRMSPGGDAMEITFAGAVLPRALAPRAGSQQGISMRNSPQGVILSVPRSTPAND